MRQGEALRCAIYTRKIDEEGLEQAFNSLDAQREACEAYVTSQAGEGWQRCRQLTTTMAASRAATWSARPAAPAGRHRGRAGRRGGRLQDRSPDPQPRGLRPHRRAVRQARASASSRVTQSFNTTTRMGRLTLNVLLSFAQFEREVTGERIRDKIAASKAKGMWMGGMPPLGYDLPEDKSRTLIVNEAEAATVRLIFDAYLELGSVHALEALAQDRGPSSQRATRRAAARTTGGMPFNRGALYPSPAQPDLSRHDPAQGRAPRRPAPGDCRCAFVRRSAATARGQAPAPRITRPTRAAARPLTGRIFDAGGRADVADHVDRQARQALPLLCQRTAAEGPAAASSHSCLRSRPIRRISAEALEAQLSRLIARLVPASSAIPSPCPSASKSIEAPST